MSTRFTKHGIYITTHSTCITFLSMSLYNQIQWMTHTTFNYFKIVSLAGIFPWAFVKYLQYFTFTYSGLNENQIVFRCGIIMLPRP